uniref:Uncharacterized protein n=1 Tax=Arundo donax TaxID=35708 RepID=A0A0A9FDN9_ARUDO
MFMFHVLYFVRDFCFACTRSLYLF